MRDWDWLRPNTINLYQYCRNDPINSWDPQGECLVNIVVGAAVGAATNVALNAGNLESGRDFAVALTAGALGGAVAGMLGPAAGNVVQGLAAKGLARVLGFALGGAVAGGTGSATTTATTNLLDGNDGTKIMDGTGESFLWGAGTGALFSPGLVLEGPGVAALSGFEAGTGAFFQRFWDASEEFENSVGANNSTDHPAGRDEESEPRFGLTPSAASSFSYGNDSLTFSLFNGGRYSLENGYQYSAARIRFSLFENRTKNTGYEAPNTQTPY